MKTGCTCCTKPPAIPGAAPRCGYSAHTANRVLLFKGGGKEVTAVIVRLPDGRTSVVLNTVTTMETMR